MLGSDKTGNRSLTPFSGLTEAQGKEAARLGSAKTGNRSLTPFLEIVP